MAIQNYLYLNIKNYLLEQIELNADKENFKLPSENQLVLKFNASRTSVRNALNLLVKNGLVYKVQGKGSYVNGSAVREILSAKPKELVCLCIPSISGGDGSFLGEIIAGISACCAEKNLLPFIFESLHDQERENEFIRSLSTLKIAGLVIYPVHSTFYNKELLRLNLTEYPIVVIDRELIGLDIDFVATDHYRLAYDATEFLIRKGHRAVTLLQSKEDTGRTVTSIDLRIRGYEDALGDHGIQINPRWKLYKTFVVRQSDYHLQTEQLTEPYYQYLRDNPEVNGILSLNGTSALALIIACNRLPKERLEQLDVVFFDDDYLEIKPLIPFRSYNIIQDAHLIGYTAADLLSNLIRHPHAKKQSILIPYREIR